MKNIWIAGCPDKTANYQTALHALGCSSITSLNPPKTQEALESFDGLVLPGGGDIDPVLFSQQNCGSRQIEPEMDRAQLALLHGFITAGKPVLGICKGMQLINVYFGGNIRQHLPTSKTHAYEEGDRYHPTTAIPDTLLYQLYAERFTVNSAHHQGIEKPGRQLAVMQYADDRVIEGLYHKTLPIVGVQWHPERLHPIPDIPAIADGSILIASFLSGYHTT